MAKSVLYYLRVSSNNNSSCKATIRIQAITNSTTYTVSEIKKIHYFNIYKPNFHCEY